MSPLSERSAGGSRRHVVQHNWASIRDAMYIAKHEHMSSVDECVSDETRLKTYARLIL